VYFFMCLTTTETFAVAVANCVFVVSAGRSCPGSGEGDANYKLIIASSADYASDAHVFCGPDVGDWKDCKIPGQSVIVTDSFRPANIQIML